MKNQIPIFKNMNLRSCSEISTVFSPNADFSCGFTPRGSKLTKLKDVFLFVCFFEFGVVFFPQVEQVLWQLCPSPFTRRWNRNSDVFCNWGTEGCFICHQKNVLNSFWHVLSLIVCSKSLQNWSQIMAVPSTALVTRLISKSKKYCMCFEGTPCLEFPFLSLFPSVCEITLFPCKIPSFFSDNQHGYICNLLINCPNYFWKVRGLVKVRKSEGESKRNCFIILSTFLRLVKEGLMRLQERGWIAVFTSFS